MKHVMHFEPNRHRSPARGPRAARRSVLSWIWILFIGFLYLHGPFIRADELEEPVPMWDLSFPDGQELIDQVLHSLPDLPLRIDAEIRTKDEQGTYQPAGLAEVHLELTDAYGQARYVIRDRFGAGTEELIVHRLPGTEPAFTFRAGTPPTDQPVPGLGAAIRDSDLTWGDLSLSFLWWPGATTVGQESVRGRKCYIVEIPAPEGVRPSLSFMRVWIDPRIGVLLRAEAHDEAGERLRTMDAKKFRKIDEIWMISTLTVTRYPTRHKTSLLVHDVSVLPVETGGTGSAHSSAD